MSETIGAPAFAALLGVNTGSFNHMVLRGRVPVTPAAERPRRWTRAAAEAWAAGLERRDGVAVVPQPPRPCQQCGRPILSTAGVALFCTRKCYRAKVRAARVGVSHPPRPCYECGKAFEPKNTRGRYCSKPCLTRAMRLKFDVKPPLPPQHCRFCNVVIDPKGEPARRRVRCDRKACVDAYHLDWKHRRNARKVAGRVKECDVCGAEFPAPLGVLKDVCSPACEAERQRRYSQGHYERQMADPDRHARNLENAREAEQRRRADPDYLERVRRRSREQNRREYRRRAELDQLHDFDLLAAAVRNG